MTSKFTSPTSPAVSTGKGQPGRADLRPQKVAVGSTGSISVTWFADFTSRLLPHLERAGVLSGNPSLGNWATWKSVAAPIQTRIGLLSESVPLVAPFFVADDQLVIADDARADLGPDAARVLDAAITALGNVDDHLADLAAGTAWNSANLEAILRAAPVDGLGLKARAAFGPVRTAVSGAKISPPLFESMEILGKTSTMARLHSLRSSL